jgi:coenzyme F420-reducing hydrogenase alpha subunit
MDKDKLIQKYKNMKQYKDLPIEELEQLVQKKIDEEELLTAFVGLLDEEKQKAIKLYDQYVSEHSFESLAEKSTLITLVYLETLNDRIKEFMATEAKDKKAIPLKMNEQLTFNTTQIMQLKEKLGMLKNKADESALDLINELKEKALAYYNEHAGETYTKCPECQSIIRLLMKVDGLEPAKATFFRGTTLYNQKLMELYHYKKVTLEEVAEIMGVHPKYITYIYENIYLKPKE